MVVVVMVIPLPVMLLDTLLATNIAIAIVVLLTAMLVNEPLEFSVFPTLSARDDAVPARAQRVDDAL